MSVHSAPLVTTAPPAAAKRKRRRRGLRTRLATLRDMLRHFSGTGRWWLMPMILIFLGSAVLLIVVQIIEYAAPFVYTLF